MFLLKGIDRFYGLKSDADVLMIGHSHLMLAVDKVALEESSGLKVAKYTREGVNMADSRVMAEQYFNTCTARTGDSHPQHRPLAIYRRGTKPEFMEALSAIHG